MTFFPEVQEETFLWRYTLARHNPRAFSKHSPRATTMRAKFASGSRLRAREQIEAVREAFIRVGGVIARPLEHLLNPSTSARDVRHTKAI